jgi:cyclopropane-fatty-acyl-phospholipid synthase
MYLLSHMLKGFVQTGTLNVFDVDGKHHVFSGRQGPEVTFRLHDKALYTKLFFNPEMGAGEGYMNGTLTFEDCSLEDFLGFFSINRLALGSYPLQAFLRKISRNFRSLQQYNPVGKAQENVAHHYDLSNDFYKLFLDEDMQYSCAYFKHEKETLEQAQLNKKRHLASKLLIEPGQRILDIGSGWGGLALYIATLADVEVVGVTLSKEQYDLSVQRAKTLGLNDRVQFKLQDYRQVEGTFDRIVSVGMFEHVGVQHYGEFFRKIYDLLTDSGVGLIHSIGHMSPPGTASPWLRKYIFPGAYSPAMSEVFTALELNSLWATDIEILRVHYANTLREWHNRFESNRDKIASMYDERFCRMWEFYLVSVGMMFRTGSQMVFQLQVAKQRDASPLTRDYIGRQESVYIEAGK